MSRPQKYKPELGRQGNIEEALWEVQYRKNEISNEVGTRTSEALQMQADFVESVIDEYNAICEEG